MTEPAGAAPPPRRHGRRIAAAILVALIILVALLTPEDTGGRTGDARLTSRSTEPQGAAALYELAGRLGWRPTRRIVDSIPLGDTTAVHLILDPPLAPSATETHEVLDRVRRGAGLVFVLGAGPLADSLGLGSRVPRAGSVIGASQILIGRSGTLMVTDVDSCDARGEGLLNAGLPFWPDRQTHILALEWKGAQPAGAQTLASVRGIIGIASGEMPAAIGFPLGRGRVVVAADPDLLRNDVLRVCRWGADVAAVRMLEYASDDAPGGGRRQRLVFDEYHQGYGEQPGTMRGILTYLGQTGSGHLMLQLAGAGLLLLFAIGPRLLVPRQQERIERRSPLEHVDALARAYRAVGATRTATVRLVHGVRRRVEHALGARSGATTDDAFLTWAQRACPRSVERRRSDSSGARAARPAQTVGDGRTGTAPARDRTHLFPGSS